MDEVPESAKNYREHANTESFWIRLAEGVLLGFSAACYAVLVVVGGALIAEGGPIEVIAISLLVFSPSAFVATESLRRAIYSGMPDLRSSEEALWVKFAWRWHRLDMKVVQGFETPDGLRICSPQLPRYCVGYRQGQTDDHRRWKGFGVSNKIPAYDSLLYNLEAGGARIAPW